MKTRDRIATIIATWFGCGYAPVAPGTCGSLGALLPAILLARLGWRPLHFVAWQSPHYRAVWSAHRDGQAPRTEGSRPGGGGLKWSASGSPWRRANLKWPVWLAAFALFRLMESGSPPRVRQLERLPGGYGIVADDVMAGVYAALVLWAAGCFNLY